MVKNEDRAEERNPPPVSIKRKEQRINIHFPPLPSGQDYKKGRRGDGIDKIGPFSLVQDCAKPQR